MSDDNSPFSKFRKEPVSKTPLAPSADARVQSLEAALRDLKADFDAYKARPLPPPPPARADPELQRRLERAESVINDLRAELAAALGREAERAEAAATKGEFKNLDLRMSDLDAAFSGLKRALSGEGEMADRLARGESELAEIKAAFSAEQTHVKRTLEDLKLGESRYTGEFTRIEHECRKALGEMRGYAESAKEKPLSERFDEHLRESVTALNGKLAEVETAMHAGLAKLSSRLNADRILYEKLFAEAEERIRKGIAPELKAAEGEAKWLRENVIWLMDEYKVVMERKVRALEGKYSAFEAISARMDTIAETLEKGEKRPS